MPGKPAINEYQVIARKYRPKTFQDVLGQEPIVTTLKNSIQKNRLGHAYLFSGSRGTGKTTLARILAKVINCSNPTQDQEPCDHCASCQEINGGYSLDVIELDGASNRGIEDIRQINDTVGYSPASGKFKIYIIDEVHMLTKEAFNALLKTLEEPPSTVKFIFATTEPHKVLPTILSRCQCFSLRRLSHSAIIQKLQTIAQDQGRTVAPEALFQVAVRAEGGLRDAESLFDQLLSFYEGPITAQNASEALGTVPYDLFFELDRAGKEGNLVAAFDIIARIFHEGKDLSYFLENLLEHFRKLIIIKVASTNSSALEIPEGLKQAYQASGELYFKEQLLSILELCLDAQSALKAAPSPRIFLEGVLLKIIRSHRQVPVDHLVERLIDLEGRLKESPPAAIEKPPQAPPPPHVETLPTAPLEATLPKIVEKTNDLPSPVISAPCPRHDTVLQFAAIELEGKIIKK